MGTWLAQAAFALTLARWQSDQSGKADGDAFFSHSFCRGLFSKAVNPERLESSVWGNVMPRPARMNCPVGVAHARRDRECVCLGSPGRIINFAEGLGTTTHFSFGTVSYSVGQPSRIPLFRHSKQPKCTIFLKRSWRVWVVTFPQHRTGWRCAHLLLRSENTSFPWGTLPSSKSSGQHGRIKPKWWCTIHCGPWELHLTWCRLASKLVSVCIVCPSSSNL